MKEQYAEQYLTVKDEEIRRKQAVAQRERMTVEAETQAKMKILNAQGDAEAYKIKKQEEAEAYRMQAEAEEMRMKGYTYQQETSRMVGMEAMQNGITGNSAGGIASGIGDIAGMGVTLGAMGSVINMTREAINPVLNTTSTIGQGIGNTMNAEEKWDCLCGNKGVTGNFCSNCGARKPEKTTWDCSCGKKDIAGNFCDNCGKRKGE